MTALNEERNLTMTLQLEGHELSYLRAIGVSLFSPKWHPVRFTYGWLLQV